MGRSCTELACHVLPGYLIDQPQVNDCTLHVAQRRHAAQSQRILLGHRNDVIGWGRVGGKAQEHLVIDDVRFDIVMAAATVACDVARKNGQHSRGVVLQANEKPRLRQIEEGQECFLNTIQRVIGPNTFPAHNLSETRPMLMHQMRHPTKEALLISQLGRGRYCSQGAIR